MASPSDHDRDVCLWSDDDGDVDTMTASLTAQLTALGIDENAEVSDSEEMGDVEPSTGSTTPPKAGVTHMVTDNDATPQAWKAANAALGSVAAPIQSPSETIPMMVVREKLSPAEIMSQPLSTTREAGPRDKKLPKKKSGRKAMTLKKLAEFLCRELEEPKYYLLAQVIHAIGGKACHQLLKKTKECEAAGGMLTMDGKRRRSKGGVFLTFLKDIVGPEELKKIYAEDLKRRKEHRSAKRKATEISKSAHLIRKLDCNNDSDDEGDERAMLRRRRAEIELNYKRQRSAPVVYPEFQYVEVLEEGEC